MQEETKGFLSQGDKLLIEPLAFGSWLEQVAPDTTFTQGTSLFCPLAKFLSEKLGREAFVGASLWGLAVYAAEPQAWEVASSALPNWAFTFVRLFDDLPGDTATRDGALDVFKKLQAVSEPVSEDEEKEL